MMRSPGLMVLAAVAACGTAAGQEPVPLPPTFAVPAPPAAGPSAAVYPPDGLLPARPPADDPPPAAKWRTDVVVGLPIALRAQRQLGESRAWFEGGVGLYVIVPSVFAGLRADADLYAGRRHTVLVRPGVDFYYSPIYSDGGWLFGEIRGIYVASVDFDLLWQARWTPRLHGLFGLKLGCGAGFAGGGSGVAPVPIIGLTFGCQF